MKVLVTGGAGFIGSHIVDKLVSQGVEVVVVDNLSSGRKENLHPKVRFYDADVSSPQVEVIFQKEKPEYVIHQAANTSIKKSIDDPLYDATKNIIGSLNILENCRRYGVKKMVYGTSGCAGVGDPLYSPIDEKHPKNPRVPYGVSKHTVDHYLHVYSQLFGLKFTSLGYANVYGPRQNHLGEGGVVALFTYKFLKNEAPIIFGDGNQVRDFIFVEDVADANIFCLTHGDNHYYNLATGNGVTLHQLIALLKEVTGSSVHPLYAPSRVGDIYESVLSPEKMKQELGWVARTHLREGLTKTVEAMKPCIT